MTAKDFIIDRLNNLSTIFTDIKFRYEIRNEYNHIIEVTPFHQYQENKDYLKAEADFENEFESSFPEDQIIFVSEDSLTQVKNVQYVFTNNMLGYDFGIIEPAQLVDVYSFSEAISMDNYYALAA